MTTTDYDRLGELQRQVLDTLWSLEGEGTVTQVIAALQRRPKPAYTTVLTVLQKLKRAGWIGHRAEGRSYVWVTATTRRDAGRGSIARLVDHVFGGDPKALFEHLLEDERLDPDDLSELRRMIERRRKELRDD